MEAERKPFALATVVRSERPTSGKPGNTGAASSPGGAMHGWIGGSCTRSEVDPHALEALAWESPGCWPSGADEGRTDDLVQCIHVLRERRKSGQCTSTGNAGRPSCWWRPTRPWRSPCSGWGARWGTGRSGPALHLDEEVGASRRRPRAGSEAWRDLLAARPPRKPACSRSWHTRDGRMAADAGAHLGRRGPDYLGVVASPRRMRTRARAVLSGLGLRGMT